MTKHYSSAGPPIEWPAGIPNTGNLTFDFVTHTKPADGVTAASNAQLTAALEACGVQFSRPGSKAILPEGSSSNLALLYDDLAYSLALEKTVKGLSDEHTTVVYARDYQIAPYCCDKSWRSWTTFIHLIQCSPRAEARICSGVEGTGLLVVAHNPADCASCGMLQRKSGPCRSGCIIMGTLCRP